MKILKTTMWTFVFLLMVCFAAASAELTVENLAVSNLNPAVAGSTAVITFDLANQGNESATNFEYTIDVTGESTRTRNVGSVIANSTSAQMVDIDFTATGNVNVTITVDSADVITETNETDNVAILPLTVVLPEINISMGNVAATVNPGAAANVIFTVSNTGNQDISSVDFSSSDLTGSAGTITANNVAFNPDPADLMVGGEKGIEITITTGSAAAGTYTGTITANYDGSNTETSTLTLTIRQPVPSVTTTGTLSLSGDEGDIASDTITIVNNGGASETVNLTATMSGFVLTVNPATLTLAGGASQVVTVSTTIPADADAKQYTGTLSIVGGITSLQRNIDLEVTGSKISIDEVEISIDGSSYDNIGSSGEDVSPFSKLDFKVTIENDFSSSGDELDNIEVTLTIDGADWDEDETERMSDIDGGDDDYVEFEGISVDGDVDDGDEYNITIYVEGEDEDNRIHTATWSGTLTIDQERDDLRITELSLGSDKLAPGGETRLRIEVTNVGSKDQDNSKIKVYSTALGISETFSGLDIDSAGSSDDEVIKYIDIKVPATLASSSYTITAEVYGEDGDRLDKEEIRLEVTGASTTGDDLGALTGSTAAQSNVQSGVMSTGGAALATSTGGIKGNFRDSGAYTAILIVGVLAVIGGGAFVVWKFW